MGILVGIYVTDRAGSPMRSIDQATFVRGKGIVGDRYFAGLGKFSPAVQDADHEVTLAEIEQVRQFNAAHGMTVRPEDLRRNLVTDGIGLNELAGAEFAVGEVVLRGIRLCEPCDYLAGLTHPEVLPGLLHRAGLRAGIVRGGVVRVGDAIAIRGVV
jgi:MOSC domain-containing protein YiiM